MTILAASNSRQQSPPPASNDYYLPHPPPTFNFENSIDLEIVIPPISPSPQVSQELDNTSNNPIVQPTFTQIQTRSKIGHSQPKSFLDYKLFYNTQHHLQAFYAALDTPELFSCTQAVSDP